MFQRLRKSKHVEELVGAVGFLCLLTLVVASFFLVRTLIRAPLAALEEVRSVKSLPSTFRIEAAEMLLGKGGGVSPR